MNIFQQKISSFTLWKRKYNVFFQERSYTCMLVRFSRQRTLGEQKHFPNKRFFVLWSLHYGLYTTKFTSITLPYKHHLEMFLFMEKNACSSFSGSCVCSRKAGREMRTLLYAIISRIRDSVLHLKKENM